MNFRKNIFVYVSILALSSCGIFSKRMHDQAQQDKKQDKAPPALAAATTPEPTTVAPPPVPVAEAVIVPSKPAHFDFAKSEIAADMSLGWLKNGNIRYTKKLFRADGRGEKDRARLTNGQHPHAIILSCSDSRVPPEIVFDQALGEIFVVRTMGEDIDASAIASIEYAVANLHTGLLIVMGHSQCGAIQATLKNTPGLTPDLEKVMTDIRPRLATMKNEPASPNLEVEATLNADAISRELVEHSSLLRSAVETGHLVIKSALYRMDTGKVTFY